ncbi:UNVERIFIED_CONTAM: b(0,+)-type amino acid transporter 1 [Trichonephila clavipes]
MFLFVSLQVPVSLCLPKASYFVRDLSASVSSYGQDVESYLYSVRPSFLYKPTTISQRTSCFTGALCYAELGTMITKSGAEYSYMMDAFGPLPAFLFSWVSVLVLKPSMMAIICLSLGEYVIEPLHVGCRPDVVSVKLVATLSIGIITYINCLSVKLATRIQNFFTAAKLLAIAIIIVGGSFKLMQGHSEHLAAGFHGSHATFSDIATAFYSGLWAYDGWLVIRRQYKTNALYSFLTLRRSFENTRTDRNLVPFKNMQYIWIYFRRKCY